MTPRRHEDSHKGHCTPDTELFSQGGREEGTKEVWEREGGETGVSPA